MSTFTIRQGDRLPELQATLTDSAGAAIDLTGLVVRFHMQPVNGGPVTVNAVATVVTPAAGTVKYAWTALDTLTPGYYRAEWEVAFGDGRKQTFPGPGYTLIHVSRELA